MCRRTHTHTHTHTHTDKRSFTLSTLYYICKPPTKDVSQIRSTHEWSESTSFPAFWMLDFPTIIVHLIRKRCVLNTLIWMFLNNTWGQTEKHLNENYTGYSLHFWNYSLWIAWSRTWPIHQLVSVKVSLVNPDLGLVSVVMAFWPRTVTLTCEVQWNWGSLVSELPPLSFPSGDGLHAATT